MAKTFARAAGWVCLLLGIVGFLVTDLLGLIQFDTVHNIVYLVLGILGIAASQRDGAAKWFAQITGPIFLFAGILGFFFPDLGVVHMESTENLLHVLLGAWGAFAVFAKSSPQA
ncbi:DUF4383 domain-containing protein [Tumebacillus flagellatus]|uniref:DUF4383 domain-containing protein n=1 Tax=Tumebacillus flagellatus TaxID=1157490 RepID=A0A074M516_9BACL|nr:DUF4383 domain-containing protein [Tumebacillus flagellatus]KEO81082.1 hypothetical protein EL26_22860 [Tumebacillus flagellatus]